jgi:hypothetical protein
MSVGKWAAQRPNPSGGTRNSLSLQNGPLLQCDRDKSSGPISSGGRQGRVRARTGIHGCRSPRLVGPGRSGWGDQSRRRLRGAVAAWYHDCLPVGLGVKHRMSLPADLVDEVERMAATSGRPVDLEYGRLLALGLLSKLAEELMPLFPEFSQPALPPQSKSRPKVSPQTAPSTTKPGCTDR